MMNLLIGATNQGQGLLIFRRAGYGRAFHMSKSLTIRHYFAATP